MIKPLDFSEESQMEMLMNIGSEYDNAGEYERIAVARDYDDAILAKAAKYGMLTVEDYPCSSFDDELDPDVVALLHEEAFELAA